MARTRESCDDRFSGFLLELAAKAAQEQLRQKALQDLVDQDMLSAFPNEYTHEIVEHFYDGDSDEEAAVEGTGVLGQEELPIPPRRKSTDKPGGWELKEMQAHQDTLKKLQEPETSPVNDVMAKVLAASKARMVAMMEVNAEKKQREAEVAEQNAKDPFWANKDKNSPFFTEEPSEDPQENVERKAMQKGASPPMLGDDIVFVRYPSPKATKFESDQPADVHPERSLNGGGLWCGYCVRDNNKEFMTPFGSRAHYIQTPTVEKKDPFASAFSSAVPKSPKTREAGVGMLKGIDDRLKEEMARSRQEDALLLEFDEVFVTQVYNYLSLGYPPLARPYDQELSKISRIPEAELRSDDHKKNAKGYINIKGPTFGNDAKVTDKPKTPEKKIMDPENYCARWKALRIYILEWARQHPDLNNGTATPSWGVRARRGSWAV